MKYLKTTSLWIILLAIAWLIPLSVGADNCIWVPNTTCDSVTSQTNIWTESDLKLCSESIKPAGGNVKCCCGQIVGGCCEKTRTDNNMVSTVNSTAAQCHQMDNDQFNVVFYQDKKAVMNKCIDKKEVESCRWTEIKPGEMSKNKVPECAAGKKQSTDNSKCGNPEPGTGSNPRICCCGTNWENDIEPEFVAPNIQVPLPGLNWTATASLNQVLKEDGSYELSIPWIAEYVKALYDYGINIAALLAGAAIMAGGLIWLISGSEANRITKAKNLLAGSFIGLLILLCAYLIFSQINPEINILKPIKLGNIKPVEVPVTAANMSMVRIGEIKGNLHFAGIGSKFALPKMISKNVYCPAADQKYTRADYKEKIKEENIEEIRNEIERIAESFVKQDAKVGYEATAYNCIPMENFGAVGGNDSIRHSCDGTGVPIDNLNVQVNLFDCGGWVGYVYACAGLGVPGGPTFDVILNVPGGLGSAFYGPISQSANIIQNKIEPGDFFGQHGVHAMLRSQKNGYYDCGALNAKTNAGCTRYRSGFNISGNGQLVTVPLKDIIKSTREKFYDCPEC